MRTNSGIALIAVMAALMVLSAIALGLAASVRTEARIEASDFQALQAEELARSGQDFATFLETRGLRQSPDFLAGLPFKALIPGFHYQAESMTGVVDIYFEADNGKLDLNNAPNEVLANFFTFWTGDLNKAQLITAAIEDWRDSDNDVRANGAEAEYYAPLHYAPRNTALGLADVPLIRGLAMTDFQIRPSVDGGRQILRSGLDAYISSAGGGSINVNFAPDLVLRSVPSLNEQQVNTILSRRIERPFLDASDLQTAIGLPANAPVWRYITVARNASAVTTIAHLGSRGATRYERRVLFTYQGFNILTGRFEPKTALGRVGRNSGAPELFSP
jgi:type II secretory pathway component PulK